MHGIINTQNKSDLTYMYDAKQLLEQTNLLVTLFRFGDDWLDLNLTTARFTVLLYPSSVSVLSSQAESPRLNASSAIVTARTEIPKIN